MSKTIIASALALSAMASDHAFADTRYDYVFEGQRDQTGELIKGTFSLTVPSVLPPHLVQESGSLPDGAKYFYVAAQEDSDPSRWFLNWSIQWPQGEAVRVADRYTGGFLIQDLLADGSSSVKISTGAGGEGGSTGSGVSQDFTLSFLSDSGGLFQNKLAPLPLDKVKSVRGEFSDAFGHAAFSFNAVMTSAVPEPSLPALALAGMLVIAAGAARRRSA